MKAAKIAKTKPCKCIDTINRKLHDEDTTNTRLNVGMALDGSRHILIATAAISPRRGFRPCVVVATFCPFCGRCCSLADCEETIA